MFLRGCRQPWFRVLYFPASSPLSSLDINGTFLQGTDAGGDEGSGEKSGEKGGGRGRKGKGGGRSKDPPATAEKLDSAMESYWGNGKAAAGEEVRVPYVQEFSIFTLCCS